MKRISLVLIMAVAICLSSFGGVGDFSSKTIQIGMIVSNLEKSLYFYKEIIGMVQVENARFDVDAEFGKRSGLTDNLPVHVEILKLGIGSEATQLKLMTFGDRATPQENEYIHSHTGVQYLTINVTNLAPILERIKAHNVPLLGETPIAMGENSFVLVQDPDGTFVELIGPMEILPPSQYEIMKEKSNFDKFKKDIPYKTPSRKSDSEKKFDFFGLFGSKKKTETTTTEPATTTTQSAETAESQETPDSQSVTSQSATSQNAASRTPSEDRQIREKFNRYKKDTPYTTPSRTDENRFIP